MSRRVYLTLSDYVYETLKQWAEKQGRPTANRAGFLIEVAVLQAQKTGEIPPPQKKAPRGAFVMEGRSPAYSHWG